MKIVAVSDVVIGYGSPQVPLLAESLRQFYRGDVHVVEPVQPDLKMGPGPERAAMAGRAAVIFEAWLGVQKEVGWDHRRRLGQVLFPFSFGNRGAAVMFEPKTYLARLKRELKFDRPTFLVVHPTAAHWPYYTAETPFGVSKLKSPEDRPIYRIGLRTADAMFDQVVSVLRGKGAFENAIVVVLSDHGEALLLPDDAIVKHGAFVKGLGAPLKVLDVGHGQSVLSQTQYKILLGFKSFGGGAQRHLLQQGSVRGSHCDSPNNLE